MRRLLVIFLLFSSFAHTKDVDTTILEKDTIKTHSIRNALLFSAIIPGAGQIYNHVAMPKGQKKAFWKFPLIYGALGTSGYFLIRNETLQRKYRREYSNRQFSSYVNGSDSTLLDLNLGIYDDAGILTIYNQYLDWRDLSILAVGAVYLIQLIDAGVEAHFVSFDISEDLSLTVDPVVLTNYTPGFSFQLNFR
ncbi:MAG: DUF5683 domain-containing protein [Crocinitomicaceae bacterium]|nr:DUF5683 domain-containing protein [Crocinitomicaceae bacterium]